ncbi:hypothetical protein B0H13DRAFT_1976335, partial [Mycena leptocephala]
MWSQFELSCRNFNRIMAKRKWYVVTVGRQVGVFKTWIEVSPLVTGVSGALHQSFPSEEEAQEVFAQAQSTGHVKIVRPTATTSTTAGVAEASPFSRRQNDFARSRPLPNPRIAGSNGHSTLNLPPVVTVKTEVIDTTSPSSYRNSSPPTGVTQVVCLSSSGALSPLALQENELEPEDSSEHPPQSSSHASSISPSPRHVATSNLSGNEFPPLTINITVPVQHIHCSACEHNLNRKENLNSLSSR